MTILETNLFKIFINELPKYLEKSSDPVILNDKPIHCLMYADDIILLSTSAPGLQEKIGILGKFCDDWCLRDRPFNLKGGGYGFLFRSEKIFRTTPELEYLFFCRTKREIFFQNLTLGCMTKTLNQIIFFSSTKIRIFFSATLGIRIFF